MVSCYPLIFKCNDNMKPFLHKIMSAFLFICNITDHNIRVKTSIELITHIPITKYLFHPNFLYFLPHHTTNLNIQVSDSYANLLSSLHILDSHNPTNLHSYFLNM